MEEWHDLLAFLFEEGLKAGWAIVEEEGEDCEVREQQDTEKDVRH